MGRSILPILLIFFGILLLITSCELPTYRSADPPEYRPSPTEPYYGVVGQAISDKYDGMLTEIYDVMNFDPDLGSESSKQSKSGIDNERDYWHGEALDYQESYIEEKGQWEVSYNREVERDDFKKQSYAKLTYQFRTFREQYRKDPFARDVYKVVLSGEREGKVQSSEIEREANMRITGLNDPPYYRIRGEHVSRGTRITTGRSDVEREENYTVTFKAVDPVIESDIDKDLLFQMHGLWDITLTVETGRSGQVNEYEGRVELDGNGYAYLRFQRDRRTIRFNALTGERK